MLPIPPCLYINEFELRIFIDHIFYSNPSCILVLLCKAISNPFSAYPNSVVKMGICKNPTLYLISLYFPHYTKTIKVGCNQYREMHAALQLQADEPKYYNMEKTSNRIKLHRGPVTSCSKWQNTEIKSHEAFLDLYILAQKT